MSFCKENQIQEAIRLVQECNFSRRKAASSTGISPNTLKRRLNGSIPREEYLEKTKKITASEELILENIIISLIQQGEHIKASTLRLLVAIYIKNKTIPSDFNTKEDLELESIPKGWCSRFMKRSNNLTVNQGIVEIVNKDLVEPLSEPHSAFSVLISPPESDKESLAETQKHIADSATALIENFRNDFESLRQSCTTNSNPSHLLNVINAMGALFKNISALATVLNFTSEISKSQNSSIQYSKKSINTDSSCFSGNQKQVQRKNTATKSSNTGCETLGTEAISEQKETSPSEATVSKNKRIVVSSEKTFDSPSLTTAEGSDTPTSPISPQSNPYSSGTVSKKRSFETLDSDVSLANKFHETDNKSQDWRRFSADAFSGQPITNYSVDLISTETSLDETSPVFCNANHLVPDTWEKRPSYLMEFKPVFYNTPSTSNSSTSFPYCLQQQFLDNIPPDEPVFLPNSCAINVASSVSMSTISDLETPSSKNFDCINLSSSFYSGMAIANVNEIDSNNQQDVNMGHDMNHPSCTFIVS